MSDNYFEFSKDEINNRVEELNLKPAIMAMVKHDLEKLKPIIEKFYGKYVFYSSWWASDCSNYGWDWNKDDGTMEDMKKVTDGITDKFKEIYTLILAGLGERIE